MDTRVFVREEEGVLKIHQFEKHHITLVLRDRIKVEEERIERVQSVASSIEEAKQMGLGFAEQYVSELWVVLERVEAMPPTMW